MKKTTFSSTGLLLVFTLLLMAAGMALAARVLPVSAETGRPQIFYFTPTPRSDGRIVYVVRLGDSCTSISLKTGLSVEELRRLNNLGGDCALRENQELLLGLAAPSTPTPTPLPESSGPPTPTPLPGVGQVCVYLFEDVNGNAVPEDTETAIAGGAVSITDRLGRVNLTGTTTATENVCFKEVPEGEFNVSVAVPEGYNATTALNYPLKVAAGDLTTLDFGAQLNSRAAPVTPSEGGRSPLLGILGGLLVLTGIGLAVYVFILRRRG